MNSIDFRQANKLLNLDLVDLESYFDSLFYPPKDFENTSDNQRRENSPFTCMRKYKIGNTFYLVETECGGTEPLPYKLKRFIFSNRDLSPDKVSLRSVFQTRRPIGSDSTDKLF